MTPAETADRPGLEDRIAFLSRPDAYAEGPPAVEVVHTHLSCVFLAGRHAYKLKKPVRADFLDLSTPEARRRNAEEELRVNRRLGPDVYEDVIPLSIAPDGRFRLGGDGIAVDWLVRMRRLPTHRMLDAAIRDGSVTVDDVRRFTVALCDFYASCEPVGMSGARYRERFAGEIDSIRRELSRPRFSTAPGALDAAILPQMKFLRDRAALLDERVRAGRIIEGHGDLRPEHVFLGDPPVFIDCLEFNRDWRLVDPADELGYLGMECEHAGAAWIGDRVLSTYRERAGDRPPDALVHFYKAYRAGLRAKLAAWHLDDHPDEADRKKWSARAAAYLALAGRYGAMLSGRE